MDGSLRRQRSGCGQPHGQPERNTLSQEPGGDRAGVLPRWDGGTALKRFLCRRRMRDIRGERPHFSQKAREMGYPGVCTGLEAELWAEGDPQIVVSAVVEVDVVADFGANADRSGESFESSAGIDGEVRRPVGQADLVGESVGGIQIVDRKIVEAYLASHK